jgi:N-acetylglucosaminyldiphosphoundecaprenol N-acetyl-beta-D-mannosaminyltransferase
MVEAVQWLLAEASRGPEPGFAVRLSNAYCVALADKDKAYRDVLNGPGITFPDGAPVVWFMRLRGGVRTASRVRGPSFFKAALQLSQNSHLSHYFIGGTEASLAAMLEAVKREYPGLRVAGASSPPFRDHDESDIDKWTADIKTAGARLVWVGLGTPKQDYLTVKLAERLGIPCIGVGAAFDFVAGTVREAPPRLQRSGFEWLFRFAMEPRRLWRRYIFGNLRFLVATLRWHQSRGVAHPRDVHD